MQQHHHRRYLLVCSQLLLLSLLSISGAEAGTVWLVVGNPVPQSGGILETALQFSSWDAAMGAYVVSLSYDPSVVTIDQIITPAESVFSQNTYADESSFTSGETIITAFQVTSQSEQNQPATFATIRWKPLAPSGTPVTIDVTAKALIDSSWHAVEVINYGIAFALESPEIDVRHENMGLPNGTGVHDFGLMYPGTDKTMTFTIENTGPADLILDGSSRVQISGDHPGDFIVTQQPSSPITPNLSVTFDIQFTPGMMGTRTATASIANNDADENPYTFTLTGTGAPQYALTVNKAGTGTGTVTSDPAGIDCGMDCTEAFVSGTIVWLTAVPATGSVVADWPEAEWCHTEVCGITMDTDKTVTATFTLYECPERSVCNGDFEQGFNYWDSTENAALVSGKSGQGAQVTADGANGDIFQLLPGTFAGGETYTATAWCKAETGERCGIFFGDANTLENPIMYENMARQWLDGNGEWQQLRVELTLSHAERLNLFLYAPVGSVVYDDVQVAPSIEPGDMNGDGNFNIFDLQMLINCIFGNGSCDNGDLNGDGNYNIFDLQQLINKIFNP